MKKISLVLLLCHWLTALTAQQQYSKAVDAQMIYRQNLSFT